MKRLRPHQIVAPQSDSRQLVNGVSISGGERNHLFLSSQGEQFYDMAGVAGLDHPGDSRAFGILDYDRDGWQDIAVVNANAPFFQLYRNQIGSRAASVGQGQMLALRFVGGNHTAEPSEDWTNRDGYGAMVTVTLGDLTLQREHRCGEGFSAQNSATMVLGIGARTQADSVVIRWPSGNIQETSNVPAGTLLIVYENPAHAPTGQAFVFQPYKVPSVAQQVGALSAHHASRQRLRLTHESAKGLQPKLYTYTTMATWCETCKRELPQLQRLRSLFGPDVVQMFGVPVDAQEGPEKLRAYMAQYQPAYTLLIDLMAHQVASVQEIVQENLKQDGLPATIVTDGDGHVLRTMWGVPTRSGLRQLLAEVSQ